MNPPHPQDDDADSLRDQGDETSQSESSPNDDSFGDLEGEDQELSLDDLGAAYARVAAEHDPEAFLAPASEEMDSEITHSEESDPLGSPVSYEDDQVATPEAIIEGALFVGHPENKSLSEQRIASLMRDVTPEEVEEIIEKLNQSYRSADQALRIVRDERGYRMTIAPEVKDVRRSFLGKVREAKLSQPAIDVLALVAYQPGVTSQVVQDQRGQDSGSILNQLVRRQLIKLERRAPESGGRKIPHYFVTERFLQVFGLDRIDDLPQVEESFRD